MTSVQFEWGDNFRVKPNELLYLLIEGTRIEDSYLTFMRNCKLGGDNFRAFRVDLGGQNSKGDNFQLYLLKIHHHPLSYLFLKCPEKHSLSSDDQRILIQRIKGIVIGSVHLKEVDHLITIQRIWFQSKESKELLAFMFISKKSFI